MFEFLTTQLLSGALQGSHLRRFCGYTGLFPRANLEPQHKQNMDNTWANQHLGENGQHFRADNIWAEILSSFADICRTILRTYRREGRREGGRWGESEVGREGEKGRGRERGMERGRQVEE